MRRAAVAALAALLAAALAGISPAAACSCLEQSFAELFAANDTVFVGTVADKATVPIFETLTRTTYRFEVETRFKGADAATVKVESTGDEAACGIDGLEPGERWLVFAKASGAAYTIALCGSPVMAADDKALAEAAALGASESR